MKKVLLGVIMNGRAGGIDKYLLDVYESLRTDGYSFDFLTNDIDVDLEQKLEDKGSNLFEIPRFTNPIGQYKEIKRIVSENAYDTVYFNISTALMCFGVLAARKAGAKRVVVHSHSSAYDCPNKTKRVVMTLIHKICKPILCKFTTDFCSCSKLASKWMFTNKVVRSGRVKMVYNAIEVEKFKFDSQKRVQMREKLGLGNSLTVGHIGNFLYPKNHEFIIDVFNQLLKKEPSAKLLLIGDGTLFEIIKDKAKQLGIEEQILFEGRQMNSNDYLQAMDVLVLPSIFEGLPIVSVESQINGLPTLLSNRITDEAKIMNSCEFLSIDSEDLWVNKILEYKNYDRVKTTVVNNEYIYDKKQLKCIYEEVMGG